MATFILTCFVVAFVAVLLFSKPFKTATKKRRKHYKSYPLNKVTPEARLLHAELMKLKIPAVLERFDGYKTVDISIPAAKLDIEVDGTHHNTNHKQALSDLKRTYYSLTNGYYTIRIPNSLIQNNLTETIDYITKICAVRVELIEKEESFKFDDTEWLESTAGH
jgi:very-short-patch-repair endonuclease